MSQLKSLKIDPEQELMWKKLSTLPVSQGDKDIMYFQQQLGRAFRAGFKKGEVSVIAAQSSCGKSMFYDIEGRA